MALRRLQDRHTADPSQAFDSYLPVLLNVLDGHDPRTALARHSG